MAKIDELLRSCTLRVVTSAGAGTGAFVAPGLVLTCDHVVQAAREGGKEVTLHWSGREIPGTIVECHPNPFPDLALLEVALTDHPCMLLDREVELGDPLYAFGFTDQEPGGDSVTLDYEGPSLRPDELHKLKTGQVRPGLSGAALLNRRTGCVCGVLKATRDRGSDLGGRAIPVDAVFAAIRGLEERQQRFHASHRTWLDCLAPDQRQRRESGSSPANPFLGDSRELIGRDVELRRIFEKLRTGNHCSLVGMPGSGKSALLQAIRWSISAELGWPEQSVVWINFRTIQTLTELQEAAVAQLGGQRATEWRSLLHAKPLRLLVLDDLGGMDPRARGLGMRRWLRGLDDGFRTKLLAVCNERLDVLFRKDDPTRDSPLAGIDPVAVELAPLTAADCMRLVVHRLAGTGLDPDDYADLCREPQQPKALLDRCAVRFEELRGSDPHLPHSDRQ